MSFSSELKTELGKVYDSARHCRIAQLAAIVCFSGNIAEDESRGRFLAVSSENPAAVLCAADLVKKLLDISCEVDTVRSSRNLKSFSVNVDLEKYPEIMETLKFVKTGGGEELPDISALTGKNCCKRAFLRGAFIAAGSISDPDKFYHFEIQCRNRYISESTAGIMNALSLAAKIITRQKHFVIYLKEIEQISDALGLMGARTSLLELENSRIMREMRGNINRRVNCETANINKAAQAAARQIEDILYLEKHMSLSSLPNGLDEIAKIRLEYPEATLSELGAYLEPPIGKSGVNHRLRKLSSIAEVLRNRGGELL